MKVKFKEAFKVKEDGSLDFENMTPDEQKKFREELAAWRKTVKTPEKDRLNENLLTDWRAIPDTYDPETLFTENLKHRSPITLREYTHWEEYGDGYQNRYGDFDDEGIDDDLYEEDDFSDTDEYVDGLDFYGDEPLENEDFYDEGEDFGFDEIPDEDTAPQIGDSIIYPEDDDVDDFVESTKHPFQEAVSEPSFKDKIVELIDSTKGLTVLAERNKYLFQEAGRKNKYTSAEVLMYFETKEDRDKAFSIFLDHDEDVYKCDAHYTPAFPGSDEKGAIERGLVIYADLYGSYDITQKDIVGKDKAGEDVVVPIKHTKYVGMDEEVNEFVLDMESLVPGKVVDYEYRGIAEDKDNG